MWDDAEFFVPSGDSSHDGESTENLSCVREKNEKENLYREDSGVPDVFRNQ